MLQHEIVHPLEYQTHKHYQLLTNGTKTLFKTPIVDALKQYLQLTLDTNYEL